MAGVEDDEIGVFDGLRFGEPFGCQNIGHALRVIDIHLTAIGLDENALCQILGRVSRFSLAHCLRRGRPVPTRLMTMFRTLPIRRGL